MGRQGFQVGPYLIAHMTIDGCPVGTDDTQIDLTALHQVTASAIDHQGTIDAERMFSVAAHNPAFDVTPANLVTALVTERGICEASRSGLLSLFPEIN